LKVALICGTRPNFVKIAALVRAFERQPDLQTYLVHTGQHYDTPLNAQFFKELAIPTPDVNLDVGSGSHAAQTALVMQRLEPVLTEQEPDLVVVVGDVNSTMAAALVAAKLHIPVAHVEAGLRSFDRSMPEEINRIVTDAISDLLFATEPAAVNNLKREGIAPERIHLVGNVMIDTLLANLQRVRESRVLERLNVRPKQFGVLTLHRPSNVDDGRRFRQILEAITVISRQMPVIFPVHPRTRTAIETMRIGQHRDRTRGVRLIAPLGYLDFIRLISEAAIVLTDSGGIQEETTVLGVPCLTLRDNTERPITVEKGTNRLVGSHPQKIIEAYREAVEKPPKGQTPELWDGKAAIRIAQTITSWHYRQRT